MAVLGVRETLLVSEDRIVSIIFWRHWVLIRILKNILRHKHTHMHTKWVTHKIVWFKLSQIRPPGNAGLDAILYPTCRLEDFPIDAFVWDFLQSYQQKDKKSEVAQQIFPFSTLYSGLTDFMRSQRDESTFKISQSKHRCRRLLNPCLSCVLFGFHFWDH